MMLYRVWLYFAVVPAMINNIRTVLVCLLYILTQCVTLEIGEHGCPASWLYLPVYNKCYLVINEAKTMPNARKQCRLYGGDRMLANLIMPATVAELQALNDAGWISTGASYFIGTY